MEVRENWRRNWIARCIYRVEGEDSARLMMCKSVRNGRGSRPISIAPRLQSMDLLERLRREVMRDDVIDVLIEEHIKGGSIYAEPLLDWVVVEHAEGAVSLPTVRIPSALERMDSLRKSGTAEVEDPTHR